MRFSKKAAVLAFSEEENLFCLHNFYAGQLLSCFGTRIGQNPDNKAELFVYDLEHDPQELASLSDDQLRARFEVHPKPIRILKANAAPILFSVEDAFDAAIKPSCPSDEFNRRVKFVRDETDFRTRLLKVYESRKPEYPASPHVEGQIYNGFSNDLDNQLIAKELGNARSTSLHEPSRISSSASPLAIPHCCIITNLHLNLHLASAYCPIIQTNVFSCSLPIIIAKLTTEALSALYFSAFRKRRKFWTNDFIFESLVIAFPVVMQNEFRNGATQR